MFHKEGFNIIILFFIVVSMDVIILEVLFEEPSTIKSLLQTSALILLLFILWFFRNPKRIAIIDDNIILSPVDGKVVAIEKVFEKEYFKDEPHLDKDFFNNWVIKGNSVLRLIHYPPVNDSSNLQRARAHEDINLITLLVGAEESGLEVLSKSGEWIPIESRSKSIVCNIGDMMQLVTRGRLKSTTHRVVEYGKGEPKSRYSMPFFLHPSPEIILKSIVDDSEGSVSAHEFLEERIRAIKLY